MRDALFVLCGIIVMVLFVRSESVMVGAIAAIVLVNAIALRERMAGNAAQGELVHPLPPSKFVPLGCDPSLLHLPHTTAMCSVPLRRLASAAPRSDLRGGARAQLSLDVREGALGLTTAPRSWL